MPLAGTVEMLEERLCMKVAALVEGQVGAVKRQDSLYFLVLPRGTFPGQDLDTSCM